MKSSLTLSPSMFNSNTAKRENSVLSTERLSISSKKKVQHDISTSRQSERPGTAKVIKAPNSNFEFVCTSEACFRIKTKLNSTAFGKSTSTPMLLREKDNGNETLNTDFKLGQKQFRQISPNMMVKPTKTAK